MSPCFTAFQYTKKKENSRSDLAKKLKSGYILTTSILYMLQDKIKLILFFFCLLTLIIHELGLGDKGIQESTWVKKF